MFGAFGITEHKILFTGPMGSGKTTAIGVISEIPPIRTEAFNTTQDVSAKATTTVGLDYGEVSLGDGEKLRLYGTPGQDRFSALWDILSNGALGVVILIDHSRPQSAADLEGFVTAFDSLIAETGAVIGVTHTDLQPERDFLEYYEHLDRRNLVLPILPVDPRSKDDVLKMIELLLSMLEVRLSELEPTTSECES